MKFNLTDSPVKSLVIVGDPEKPTLDSLLEHAPDLVIFIEPEAEKARQLSDAMKSRENVHVVTGTIGKTGQAAKLVEYNFPGLRSLRTPAETLHELFPGLTARNTVSVELQSFADLAATLPELVGPTALWIDLPGSELEILGSIEEAGILGQVHRLTMRCNTEPVFKNSPGAQDVLNWLQERFFTAAQRDDADPDWPIFHMVEDQMARENRQLQANLTEMEAQLISLETELANTRSHNQTLEHSSAELQQALQSHKENVQALEAELTKEQKALAKSLEERTKRAEALREAQERAARVPKLEASLEAANKSLDVANKNAETAAKSATEKEIALATANESLNAISAELETSQSITESLRASLEAATHEAALAGKRASESETSLSQALEDLNTVRAELAPSQKALSANEEQLRLSLARINELESLTQSQVERISTLEASAKRRTEELERVQERVASAAQKEQSLELTISQTQEDLKKAQDALKANSAEMSVSSPAHTDPVKQFEDVLERKLVALTQPQPNARDKSTLAPDLNEKRASQQTYEHQEEALVAAQLRIEALQSDLAIALRMQQQAQADLRELRSRYQDNEEVRATQFALLQKLTPRLTQAAQHLQQMAFTEDLPEALAIEVSETPPKVRATRTRKGPAKSTAKSKAKAPTRKRSTTTKKITGAK